MMTTGLEIAPFWCGFMLGAISFLGLLVVTAIVAENANRNKRNAR